MLSDLAELLHEQKKSVVNKISVAFEIVQNILLTDKLHKDLATVGWC